MIEHIMSWPGLIVSFISGGGLVAVFTLKQTKESKALDNAAKLIDQYNSLIKTYESRADRAEKRAEEAEKKVEELEKVVHQLQQKVIDLEQKLSAGSLLLRTAEVLRCENIQCLNRIPPLNKKALVELYQAELAEIDATENIDKP